MKIHLTGDDSLSPPCRVSVYRKVVFNPFSELARNSSHHPSDGPPHPLAGGTTGEGKMEDAPKQPSGQGPTVKAATPRQTASKHIHNKLFRSF